MKNKGFKKLELSKAFQFIEPGPVVLVTTVNKKGKTNVMTMSWHMVMDFTPQIGCIIGPWDYSYKLLRETKECVISIPTVEMATKTVEIGNCSGEDIDKFKEFKLTQLKGKKVKAPLIAECLVNIECKVVDSSLVKKYCLFILEGVYAWINDKKKEQRTFHAKGDGTFAVDGRILNLKDKMVKWTEFI